MRNILEEINEGKITFGEAYDIVDEIVSLFHLGEIKKSIPEELGLDHYEWTALSSSLGFEEMVQWRYNSWPKVCSNCNKEIDYKKDSWTVTNNKLKCLQC